MHVAREDRECDMVPIPREDWNLNSERPGFKILALHFVSWMALDK